MATGLPESNREPRPLALAAIAVTGVLASGFLGGTTNAVNGAVSPTYFVTILGWRGVEDVWRASVAQGVFEGLLFGIFFSLLFTVATGIITGASCSFGFAFKHFGDSLVLAPSWSEWLAAHAAAMEGGRYRLRVNEESDLAWIEPGSGPLDQEGA